MNKDLDLCVFISSKDRYGRTEDYKITITSFLEQAGDSFNNKYVNIKVFNGDEKNALNIESFFKNLDFKINIIKDEIGILNSDRYDNRQKFISGITADISNFFLKYQNTLSKYVFILEDDSPIVLKKYNFQYYENKSKILLQSDEDIEAIHFLRLSCNEIPCSPLEWFIYHNIEDLKNEEIITEYWYNFQPRICRTDTLIKVCLQINQNWDFYKSLHTEDAFDKAYKQYNKNIRYYAFSPYNAYSIHLGLDTNLHKLVLESEPEINSKYNS
jgi:hypothetical protein